MTDQRLRFAVFGTGFWSNFQIPAWYEVGGVDLVAAYNRTVDRARKIADKFSIPSVYGDAEELLRNEEIDFMDIITEIDGHAPLVALAAKYRKAVICQKPMAPDLATAEKMVALCAEAGVPLYIHENWRWQTPIRELSKVFHTGVIGKPFRARIDMISGFPVFTNQPCAAHPRSLHPDGSGQPHPGRRPFPLWRSRLAVLSDP